ncbi:MAG: metallophosphoesterase family protein [Saprospiraceae bacterium]|nr:metallophosphoesterase family protein [Saprospiraceae bacterium]
MKKIGLLSDTHGYLDPTLADHFSMCDEIWHAGDIGNLEVIRDLEQIKPLRAVYGNIDDRSIRSLFPEDLRFDVDGLDVFITHIGGYPGRYNKRVKTIMDNEPPKLFICGHSHILKVIYDQKYQCLHMNPGACGHHGFHKVRTALRFDIDEGKIKNLEAIELGWRGRISS